MSNDQQLSLSTKKPGFQVDFLHKKKPFKNDSSFLKKFISVKENDFIRIPITNYYVDNGIVYYQEYGFNNQEKYSEIFIADIILDNGNIIHTKVNNISKLVREGYSLFELTANDINENNSNAEVNAMNIVPPGKKKRKKR